MFEVEVRLCVITKLTKRGKGTTESPIRLITEVWDATTGSKLAENDPMFTYSYEDDKYIVDKVDKP